MSSRQKELSKKVAGYKLTNSKRHGGELITRVPPGYLLWMVNVGHSEAEYAEAEIERRGIVFPEMEISGHAIDRASLRLNNLWVSTMKANEGIYAWLHRFALEAIKNGEWIEGNDGTVIYQSVRFVFEINGRWPVLKTLMPNKKENL